MTRMLAKAATLFTAHTYVPKASMNCWKTLEDGTMLLPPCNGTVVVYWQHPLPGHLGMSATRPDLACQEA